MKKRRDAVPTRERILDEVERLIVRKGVYNFKLHDVADRLGMKVPAIYKHYANRDDVLIEVSRRFVTLLADQFPLPDGLDPRAALRVGLDRLVEFNIVHPAYVRLALVDYATPEGGMEYVKHAAGGSFLDNFSAGPLAPMHRRLRGILRAGARAGQFRRVDATDFFRVATGGLLVRLVFPDDALLLRRPLPRQIRSVQRWLWEVARRYLEMPSDAAGRSSR